VNAYNQQHWPSSEPSKKSSWDRSFQGRKRVGEEKKIKTMRKHATREKDGSAAIKISVLKGKQMGGKT